MGKNFVFIFNFFGARILVLFEIRKSGEIIKIQEHTRNEILVEFRWEIETKYISKEKENLWDEWA